VTWSLEDVLGMYTHPARIIQSGKPAEVEALTGVEKVTFPPPIGDCEAFYTDGLSTLLSTIRNVDYMDEKTIRYPGHVGEIRTLIQCGLLDQKPIEFAGARVSPREFTTQVLTPKLNTGEIKDVTLLRIDVKGRKGKREVIQTFEMIDHYDERERTTSMARTTAFPASIAAQMVANGEVKEKGLVPCELAFRGEQFTKFIKELSARRIMISVRREEIGDLSKPEGSIASL
jgi:lysine 6-dehydrogenase